MAERLKATGKSFELIVLEGGEPLPAKAANRTRRWTALEQFLAKNLPVSP
jgi:hypothetical protein